MWREGVTGTEGSALTSRLDAKVDLALGRMRDGVAAELHIRAGERKQETKGETQDWDEG